MTSDFSQEQAQQAQCVRNSRVDAVSDIPVLVRLPNLGEQAAEVQAAVETEIFQQDVPASLQKSIVLGDDTPAPGPSETGGEAESMKKCGTSELPQTESLAEKGVWSWSDFRVPPPVAHALVALSLIAVFVVAYMAIVAGGDASNEIAAEKTVAEGGKPSIARGQDISVPDDTLLDIDFASLVPETRETPVVSVKESRKAKKPDTKLPATQPLNGENPPATELENPLILQQADEPAMVTKYETPNVLRRHDWNEYVIRCRGRRVQLSINGHQAMDYTEPDESISQLGVIGLRIHVGPPSEAFCKDIELTGEVAPCELTASGLGVRTSPGADRPFPFQSHCFGGNETYVQNGTCVKSEHTGRPVVGGIRTPSIRFLENPKHRHPLPCRPLGGRTATSGHFAPPELR